MSDRILVACLVAVELLLTPRSRAAAPASLQMVIERALKANPDIHLIEAAAEESHSAANEIKARYLPKLSLVGQYTTSDDPKRQLPDSNQVVVRLEESLFQGGRLLSDLHRLRSLEQGAQSDVSQKRTDILVAVHDSFYRAVTYSGQIKTYVDAMSELRSLLKLIEPKFTLGAVPEYDYIKVRLSVFQYEKSRAEAQNLLEHELYVLGAAMAAAPPDSVEVPLDLTQNQPPPEVSLEEVISNALNSRADLKSAQAIATAQNFSLQSANRLRWPDLKITADYGYAGLTPNDLSSGWGFSALLTLPLFDFGEISSRVSQERSKQTQQEAKTDALRLKIRTEIRDALGSVKTGWDNLEASRAVLPDSKRAYHSSLRRYRTGLAAMTELSDSHDLWVQSRVNLIQAASTYRASLTQLQAAQGTLPIPGRP